MATSRVRKKDGLPANGNVGVPHPWIKRSLLSLTSLPSGETRVREQATEILFPKPALAVWWFREEIRGEEASKREQRRVQADANELAHAQSPRLATSPKRHV